MFDQSIRLIENEIFDLHLFAKKRLNRKRLIKTIYSSAIRDKRIHKK